MGVIYKIENTVNHKVYIGQTSNKYPSTRWSAHKNTRKNHPLYNSIKKYGIENFTFIVVINDVPIEELSEKEKEYIKLFDCIHPRGYNLTPGGKALRGKDNPMFGKSGKRNPNYGNKWTDEQKESASLRAKRAYTQNPSRKMIGEKNGMFNKPNPFASKNHTKESKIRNRLSQETRIPVDMTQDNVIVKRFNSLGEAAEWIRENTKYEKADYSTIKKSIINNWNCYNYKFKIKKI